MLRWLKSFQENHLVLYCDEDGRENKDSFRLSPTYKGLIVKSHMRQLGAIITIPSRPQDRNSRAATFPLRLVESNILEYFRNDLLAEG